MSHAIFWIFVSQFMWVFTLGFQSRAVNTGQRWIAALNSFVIGVAQLGVLKLVPKAITPLEIAIFLMAGPAAIASAMFVHAKFFKRN